MTVLRLTPLLSSACLLTAASPAHAQLCVESVTTWGGAGTEWGVVRGVDAGGGFHLSGETDSFGAGNGDMFLARYDANGELSWARTFGGSEYDGLEGGAVDAVRDAVYATGHTEGFGATTSDLLVVKFDTAGNLVWARTWGQGVGDDGDAIAIDPSTGDVIVAGVSPPPGEDGVVLRIDPTGSLVWARTWGAGFYDSFNGVAVDPSTGDVYLAGNTDGFGVGATDALVVKLDAAGNEQWARTWGTTLDDDGFGMFFDPATSSVYTCGITNDGGAGQDAFVARWDTSGNLLWDVSWSGPGENAANGLAFDGTGDVWVGAESEGLGVGPWDALVMKLDVNGTLLSAHTWGGEGEQFVAEPFLFGGRVVLSGITSGEGGLLTPCTCTLSSPSAQVTDPGSHLSPLSGTLDPVSGTVTSPTANCGGGYDVLLVTLDPTGGCAGTSYCQGLACPCANDDVGAGCSNSTGRGAYLRAEGSTSVAADDLVVTVRNVPAGQNGILFLASSAANIPFGDGKLCAVGGIVRLGVQNAGTCGVMTAGPGLAAATGLVAGDVRMVQGWFRDPSGPCGNAFNTSDAMEFAFVP